MLDLRYIREHPEQVSAAIANKGEAGDVSRILALDERRRDLLQRVETLKHDRNTFSQEVSRRKREKENADELIEKTRAIGQEIKQLDEELKGIQESLAVELDRLPNLPHESVPVGRSADENVEVRVVGSVPEFDFEIADHLTVGERLDIIDFPRGSKVTGRGFPVYKGRGARLERALINFMLDTHSGPHGYREIIPPFLANRESMRGTGQLPKLEEDMYFVGEDDLFLIPTAEVSVTNLHRDEIIEGEDLPIRYCAYSPCFRREAGSWGKDTRGFQRLHQFNKVELVKFVRPESSYDELELLLKDACRIIDLLGLHYRVIELCTGDLSFAAAKCYDIEIWAPADRKWLEVSSCSNFADFQARRMNVRFRPEPGGRPELLHTLNGSGLATPRLMVAILETFQTADGAVVVPEPLRPYTGFDIIRPEDE